LLFTKRPVPAKLDHDEFMEARRTHSHECGSLARLYVNGIIDKDYLVQRMVEHTMHMETLRQVWFSSGIPKEDRIV
jgi:hypothetical protein